jgi:hypothetical protein
MAFGLAWAATHWVRSPGYMDADYYYATAVGLARGEGLRETFLWNYLDNPAGLPHPSHLYWMPLTTLVASLPMALGGVAFRTAQTIFVLLSALVPAMTGVLAAGLTSRRDLALQAAWLSAFSGFFLPYFVTTDAFVLCALLGGGMALVLARAPHQRAWPWMLLGALTGAAHLARADGLLWLLPLALVWSMQAGRRPIGLAGLLGGYAAVMAPWWLRNVAVVGSAFPPGSAQALWLTSYDELFSFPASALTPAHLAASGGAAIARVRWDALLTNLRSLLVVNGLVYLLPLAGLAAWKMRRLPAVAGGLAYLGVLLAAMSFVFPFAGARGGFFHSSAFLMPLLWSLAPIGLSAAVAWIARRRAWDADRAGGVFAGAAIAFAAALTAGIFVARVIGPGEDPTRWQAEAAYVERVGNALDDLDSGDGVAAVNNPPALAALTGRPAVVLPHGDVASLRAVVERYDVRWVVIDENRPEGLRALYDDRESVRWLEEAATVRSMRGEAYILRVVPEEPGG